MLVESRVIYVFFQNCSQLFQLHIYMREGLTHKRSQKEATVAREREATTTQHTHIFQTHAATDGSLFWFSDPLLGNTKMH
jgi:hypothetical protein